MATYYLPESMLAGMLQQAKDRSVFAPVETAGLTWMDAVDAEPSLSALRRPRPAQSPKGFLLPASTSVGRYGQAEATAAAVETAETLVVGVRACELRAMSYLDKVMLAGEFEDPSYRARREGMLLVSCDCVDCTESCCCTLVGGAPFATEGFDVNLSPVNGGFLAEACTDRGWEWLDTSEAPGGASDKQLAERQAGRDAMVERLERQNAAFTFSADEATQPALPNEDSQAWQQYAADCVECGACTNICPTCHCFYLYDQVLGEAQFERVRTWDSCLLSTYDRMAGGANMKISPRPTLSSRLANRVLHKFAYSPQQYGLLGCVGCGRCIDACLGAIDIRKVVEGLKTATPGA